MRDLAIFIATGWFWLLFYGVGPLNGATQLMAGGGTLTLGCLLSALWGIHVVRRRAAATRALSTRRI